MDLREIPGVLLVSPNKTSAHGPCNRTRRPVPGSVLVVEALSPDLYDAIVTSTAVICTRGGRTGHMQSLCRSRGIPVLRVAPAELPLLTGEVTVRLDRSSVVLSGAVPAPRAPQPRYESLEDVDSVCVVIADSTDIRSTNTLTNLERVNRFFIREEFTCLSADLSPIDALRAGVTEAERYGARIAAELCAMVEELLPHQTLVMRLLDLRSDDAAHITTGVQVDDEPNPEMGLHGARWLLEERLYPHAFRALRAHLRHHLGPSAARITFAVPFINDQTEFLRLRRHLGLTDDTPLGVFVETPAAVHAAGDFCRAGASELFIGTKDLIQFYLAADRGNHLVASIYQTRHPAVLAALAQAVEAGTRTNTPVHVFALGADVDHYVSHLPTRKLMMCTAELHQAVRHLATPVPAH